MFVFYFETFYNFFNKLWSSWNFELKNQPIYNKNYGLLKHMEDSFLVTNNLSLRIFVVELNREKETDKCQILNTISSCSSDTVCVVESGIAVCK